MAPPPTDTPRHLAGCAGFWMWVLVGAVFAVGMDVPPVLLAAGGLGLLVGRISERRGVWGLATGAGLPFLYVAYLNRQGPGTVCHAIGTARYPGTECGDVLDPLPWLVLGLVLIGPRRRRLCGTPRCVMRMGRRRTRPGGHRPRP